MCTGAELAAAMAAAGGTEAAAAGVGETALTGLAAAAPVGASGAAEMAGLGAATPGIGGLLAASSAPAFGAAGGISDAAMMAGAPQAANPLSVGLGNLQTQFAGPLNALSSAQKIVQPIQMAQGLMARPAPAGGGGATRPPSGPVQPMPDIAQRMGGPQGMAGGLPPELIAQLRAKGIDPMQFMMMLRQRGG